MMQKFPGIHYNIVCRSVAPECLPQATLHRRGSMNRETVRREVLTTRRPEQLYLYNKIKLENSKNTKEYLDFFKKHRIQLGQLPKDGKKEYLRKIGGLSELNIEELLEFYQILYPFKEKYTPLQILDSLSETYWNFENFINISKELQKPFDEIMMNEYLDRIDKEYVEKMSEEEKKNFLLRIKTETTFDNPLLLEKIKKLLQIEEEKNSPLFTQIIEKLKSILDRDYPKAKNLRDLLRTKQIAIYNNLLGIKDKLLSLSDSETMKLIQFLQDEKIIEGDKIIVKKIKHLIRPANYPNPLLRSGGGTRKQKRVRVNNTRKH